MWKGPCTLDHPLSGPSFNPHSFSSMVPGFFPEHGAAASLSAQPEKTSRLAGIGRESDKWTPKDPFFWGIMLVAQSRLTHYESMDCSPTRLLCPWNFPGKNTAVDCHFLLQGIFLTQGLNLCLLHCHADSLLLSHLGTPKRRQRC